VLMTELGVRFTDSMSILVSIDPFYFLLLEIGMQSQFIIYNIASICYLSNLGIYQICLYELVCTG
jgi:hypothetical protein